MRAVDTGGNVVERGPYQVDVATPSDRGALNGVNATETGRVTARFTRGSNRGRRTIGFLSKADVTGRLVNDAGVPIANASVAVLTRDLDDDDAKLRTHVTTDGDGRFRYRATAYASRLYQFAWASHVNDVRFAANGYVTLLARASATIHSRPHSTSVGRADQALRAAARQAAEPQRRHRRPGPRRRRAARGARSPTATSAATAASRSTTASATPPLARRRFSFRIKIERDSGFAYWGGYSRTARVRVR